MMINNETLSDYVQLLLDEREIWRLMVEYFDAVDALDPKRAVQIFSDDVTGDFMTGRVYQGRGPIERVLGKILLQYEQTSHHITNHRAEVSGDVGTACTWIYAFHRMAGTDEVWHLWARHIDDLERIDGSWRVSKRVLSAIDSEPRWDAIKSDWYYGHPDRRDRAVLEAELNEAPGRQSS
jgi:ketosteroid isomerase-like protein